MANEKLAEIDRKLEKLTGLEEKVTHCVNKVSELECSLASMAKKLDDLENRSRRSNLIVYGVNEQDNETTEKLEKAVIKEIFQDVLGVNILGVERIHRLGRPKQGLDNKPRPVILKLLDFRDKDRVMKNCPKLKGSAFSVSEDFSQAIRDVRKKLWLRTKENRDRHEKVRLVYDKVNVDGHVYRWDESRNDMVEITKNPQQKAAAKQPAIEERITRSRSRQVSSS